MNELLDRLSALVGAGTRPAPAEISAVFAAAEQEPDSHPSFWHPLGFVHVRLYAEPGRSLRLHLWPRGRRVLQEPLWLIHDHIFTLRSVILVGAVRNTVYEAIESEHARYRIYEVSYGGPDSSRNKLTATSALVLPRSTLSEGHVAGAAYSIPPSVFHESVVSEDVCAATLVLTSDPLPLSPRVVGDASAPSTISVERRRCSTDELRRVLAEFRALL